MSLIFTCVIVAADKLRTIELLDKICVIVVLSTLTGIYCFIEKGFGKERFKNGSKLINESWFIQCLQVRFVVLVVAVVVSF